MKKFDIKSEKLKFKNLITGPAPVGRILNYIYLAGKGKLFHKNGQRNLYLINNIASAWASEFMIGLGIFKLGNEIDNKVYSIILTESGKKLFDLMESNYIKFNEGTNKNDFLLLKEQINRCNKKLYDTYKGIFLNSYPYKILYEYLKENGYTYKDKKAFMNDFYENVKVIYGDAKELNRKSRMTAGENRAPSLLQLCEFFDILNGNVFANITGAGLNINKKYLKKDLENAANKEKLIITDLKKLVDKYGEDGNEIIKAAVRNSNLQKMFKHNLCVSQKKCVICGIEKEELLIGSHIKESSESNTKEKVDHNNGLLLCCNHDKLFDRHLITFDSTDGKIRISKTIEDEDIKKLGLNFDFKLREDLMTAERKNFLEIHNKKFQIKERTRTIK